MAIEFQDTRQSLSATLFATVDSIQGRTVTLRQLFALIGEQGLLFLCALLAIPFLIPVSIPGVSTVFGAGIILIATGITLNRLPWLPGRILDRPLETGKLVPALRKGAEKVARIDGILRPRLLPLTGGALMNRANGLALVFGGVLLIFPLGLIPFSNTLPAFAILSLAVGALQRDGLFVLLGYLLLFATIIYFGVLAVGAMLAGTGLAAIIGG
nr:MAG: protein exod [Chloroflexota bacterium]